MVTYHGQHYSVHGGSFAAQSSHGVVSQGGRGAREQGHTSASSLGFEGGSAGITLPCGGGRGGACGDARDALSEVDRYFGPHLLEECRRGFGTSSESM